MAWATSAEDAKMLLDISSTMNNALNEQLLAFDLADSCLNTTLCKSLPCFAEIRNVDYNQKSPKFSLKSVKFSISKQYISISF